MVQDRLKADLKKLVNSELVGRVTKQWGDYEDRVLKLVKEFDLKSREARDKSRKRLDQFTVQLKRTRTDIEKKVSSLLNEEGKRLNEKVGELVNYLKSMANSEKLVEKANTTKKKVSTKARTSVAQKTSAKKATTRAPGKKRAVKSHGAETSQLN